MSVSIGYTPSSTGTTVLAALGSGPFVKATGACNFRHGENTLRMDVRAQVDVGLITGILITQTAVDTYTIECYMSVGKAWNGSIAATRSGVSGAQLPAVFTNLTMLPTA